MRKRLRIYQEIRQYVSLERIEIGIMLFLGGMISIFDICNTLFYKEMIDKVMIKGDFVYLKFLLVGYLSIFGMRYLVSCVEVKYRNKKINMAKLKLQKAIYRKIMETKLGDVNAINPTAFFCVRGFHFARISSDAEYAQKERRELSDFAANEN